MTTDTLVKERTKEVVNKTATQSSFSVETTSSNEQLNFFKKLEDKFTNSPLPKEELMRNFALYTRSSILARFLVLDDLYKRIKNIPGAIIEFGVWWGQNLITFENLRAIHEPFNKQRVIMGFDTFTGYTGFSDKDKKGDVFNGESYSTSKSYKKYLEELLQIHEGNNVLGHVRGVHKLIEGDIIKTAPKYFKEHPETVVALSYFDLGLYKPTKAALEAIKPHLVSGSVILLDEFTWSESPGEAIAFKEVFKKDEYTIEKCQYMPHKTIVTIR